MLEVWASIIFFSLWWGGTRASGRGKDFRANRLKMEENHGKV